MAISISPDPGIVAVLGGAGEEGSGLVLRWVHAGFNVLIGSRNPERAEIAADTVRQRVGPRAVVEGLGNLDAAQRADTIVLAVPFAVQQSLLKDVEAALTPGKVVVDITVPLASAVGGRPTAVLGVWQGSAAQQAASAVPRGVVVVSAFHNVSARHLNELDEEVACDVLACGDNREAKERVRRLAQAIAGCRYVDAGPLANSRIVESLTALLIGINIRYKVPGAGIRLTGIPALGEATGSKGSHGGS
ncbi:MAG: 8-hydroxy-5-deazaflavin:NADPH oxidoreductase [Chloroflexota bacterium]|nr:8-hydroxy-5-deazaflavin:NADPH oxidoreductase [Chloroflexota bacterium]